MTADGPLLPKFFVHVRDRFSNAQSKAKPRVPCARGDFVRPGFCMMQSWPLARVASGPASPRRDPDALAQIGPTSRQYCVKPCELMIYQANTPITEPKTP